MMTLTTATNGATVHPTRDQHLDYADRLALNTLLYCACPADHACHLMPSSEMIGGSIRFICRVCEPILYARHVDLAPHVSYSH